MLFEVTTMKAISAFIFALLCVLCASAQAGGTAQQGCPVTKPPQHAFVPPPPYAADPAPEWAGTPEEKPFWYGTPKLWTAVSPRTWKMSQTTGYDPGNPDDHSSLREKLFWWSEGLDWRAKQTTRLEVTGKRLDAPAPSLITDGPGTPSFQKGIGPFFVVGINIPTAGCWEITGHYKGTDLSYVIWVSP